MREATHAVAALEEAKGLIVASRGGSQCKAETTQRETTKALPPGSAFVGGK
jgi:hypothetical protein